MPTDSSLALAREFCGRGYKLWMADTPDVFALNDRVYFAARPLVPKGPEHFKSGKPIRRRAGFFDLVLIRKEPPFDAQYLYLTYLLEIAAKETVVTNDPCGIRNANEKLSSLPFSRLIPETLVSASIEEILSFQTKLKKDLVIKPLNQKWGLGVYLLRRKDKSAKKLLAASTKNESEHVIAQCFIQSKTPEKRITILNGKILAAYEKIAAKGEFRANIHAGGTYRRTVLSAAEKQIAKSIAPYLKKEGLLLSGIDVIGGKLLEINVTCPGAIRESGLLYPGLEPIKKWAIQLLALANQTRR